MKITSVNANYDNRYIKIAGVEYQPTCNLEPTERVFEEVVSVKIDNQDTFNCIDEPSDMAQAIPSVDGHWLNEQLPMDNYICNNIDRELLFLFVTVRSYIYYFYDEEGQRWVRVRVNGSMPVYETTSDFVEWNVIDTTSPVTFKMINGGDTLNITTNAIDEYWYLNAASFMGLSREMKIDDAIDTNKSKLLRYGIESIYKTVLYNNKALMRYILDHVKELLKADCCDNLGKVHCEYLMMRNGFNLSLAGCKYKEACKFWKRLYKNMTPITSTCNCNG